jgi:hypothetical protein
VRDLCSDPRPFRERATVGRERVNAVYGVDTMREAIARIVKAAAG